MQILISPTKEANGLKAAAFAAERLQASIRERGGANIIVATGASQFESSKPCWQSQTSPGKK